ncbi:FAD-dependent oxidoreductase [Vibrio sp. FNV 38]|nr:FAD-dependent oxidoreductase [Vibrio sp. FNV 38]
MKIAIIGSGISGLSCGYYLAQNHDITIYEANDYVGGHTATKQVQVSGHSYNVDTGFIVYNDRTYPNFIKMMNEIGVKGIPTQMSFSVRNDGNGLEYNGHTLTTLFAQKRNWLSPNFYRFIAEIVRFNKLAKSYAENGSSNETTLGQFLSDEKFSDYFCENYILPMGAAIWSSTLADMRKFPLPFFLRFFLNHGLLDITNRPQWYVIEGGSNAYIEPLTKLFSDRIRLNAPVVSVTRDSAGVVIESNNGKERFDQVIFACHSDQALRLIQDPSELECEILSDMKYQANEVVLHTDDTMLPKRKAAWASWNYYLSGEKGEDSRLPALTYNMNILQHIDSPQTFCVSLNCADKIDPTKILQSYTYHHPVFTRESIVAQERKSEVNGVNNTWFCGAYWHNGFHEDGVRSALDVVKGLDSLNSENQGAA